MYRSVLAKNAFVAGSADVESLCISGEELRKLIGAPAYIECSSKTQQNVKGVFDAAIRVVLQPPKQKKKKPHPIHENGFKKILVYQ
ncbi:hypothetical protein M0R45_003958 [Rubus argutus]|uniref:Uncharacterized protein n=1 Tax=Rubus argutus TaxID=59490 RepID=A0AAW1YHN8_RUBAR